MYHCLSFTGLQGSQLLLGERQGSPWTITLNPNQNIHVLGLWEEAGVPRRKQNMKTNHRKPPSPAGNQGPGPFLLWGITAAPPYCPHYRSLKHKVMTPHTSRLCSHAIYTESDEWASSYGVIILLFVSCANSHFVCRFPTHVVHWYCWYMNASVFMCDISDIVTKTAFLLE